MSIKVSVIIPMYNKEKYIEKCIRSIQKQKLKDIEIIVIDDGSSDKSNEIVESFAKQDNRIKLITKQNTGVSDTRNIGIMQAKGEYIGFVDADDWIHEDMYDVMYKSAIKLDADIIRCGLSLNKEDGQTIEEIYIPYIKSVYYKQEIQEKFIRPLIGTTFKEINEKHDRALAGYSCVHIYKKGVIINNGIEFDTKQSIYEDLLFNIKSYMSAETVGIVNNIFYFYRQNNSSALNSYKANLENQLDYLVENIFKIIKHNNFGHIYYEALNYRICMDVMWAVSNICSVENKERVGFKLKRIRKLFKKTYVEAAFRNVNNEGLSFTKFIVFNLMKYKMYKVVLFLYLLKQQYSDWLRKGGGNR